MRVFKLKDFGRTARRLGIDDRSLSVVVKEVSSGKIDAALGAGLIKQRVAREGGGKSGGYRVVVAVRLEERMIFLEVFAKNEEANISPLDLQALKIASKQFLKFDDRKVASLLSEGAWIDLEFE